MSLTLCCACLLSLPASSFSSAQFTKYPRRCKRCKRADRGVLPTHFHDPDRRDYSKPINSAPRCSQCQCILNHEMGNSDSGSGDVSSPARRLCSPCRVASVPRYVTDRLYERLPDEILVEIFLCFGRLLDCRSFRSVCTRFYDVTEAVPICHAHLQPLLVEEEASLIDSCGTYIPSVHRTDYRHGRTLRSNQGDWVFVIKRNTNPDGTTATPPCNFTLTHNRVRKIWQKDINTFRTRTTHLSIKGPGYVSPQHGKIEFQVSGYFWEVAEEPLEVLSEDWETEGALVLLPAAASGIGRASQRIPGVGVVVVLRHGFDLDEPVVRLLKRNAFEKIEDEGI